MACTLVQYDEHKSKVMSQGNYYNSNKDLVPYGEGSINYLLNDNRLPDKSFIAGVSPSLGIESDTVKYDASTKILTVSVLLGPSPAAVIKITFNAKTGEIIRQQGSSPIPAADVKPGDPTYQQEKKFLIKNIRFGIDILNESGSKIIQGGNKNQVRADFIQALKITHTKPLGKKK